MHALAFACLTYVCLCAVKKKPELKNFTIVRYETSIYHLEVEAESMEQVQKKLKNGDYEGDDWEMHGDESDYDII